MVAGITLSVACKGGRRRNRGIRSKIRRSKWREVANRWQIDISQVKAEEEKISFCCVYPINALAAMGISGDTWLSATTT